MRIIYKMMKAIALSDQEASNRLPSTSVKESTHKKLNNIMTHKKDFDPNRETINGAGLEGNPI